MGDWNPKRDFVRGPWHPSWHLFPLDRTKGDVNILLRPVDRYGRIEYLHVLKVSYI